MVDMNQKFDLTTNMLLTFACQLSTVVQMYPSFFPTYILEVFIADICTREDYNAATSTSKKNLPVSTQHFTPDKPQFSQKKPHQILPTLSANSNSSDAPLVALFLNTFAAPVSITPVLEICLCKPSSPSSCTACPFPILLKLSRIKNS